MQRRVVVLGMHRSGTSAVTRVVNLLGLPLGDPGDRHEGWDNPRGHWESRSLIEVNDRILAACDGTWAAPPVFPAHWATAPALADLRRDAEATFRRVHPGDDWVWKDPRTCLTLPLWREVLEDFAVVLILRDPDAVAASLTRRDGLSHRHGVLLWERYLRATLAEAAGLPTVVARYEDIAADPAGGVAALAEGLGALGIPTGDRTEAVASIAAVPARPRSDDPLLDRAVELVGTHEALPVVDLPPESPELQRLFDRVRGRSFVQRVVWRVRRQLA